MILGNTELTHLRFLIEELLFRLKEEDNLAIEDLEDEIRICAEIVGLNPDLEQDTDE